MLGQRTRGLIVGTTIICLWISGLLLGGISVIDQRRNPAWFLGQALIAPSLAVNYYHHRLEQRYRVTRGPQPPQAGEPEPVYEPAYGRMAEIGTLYTTLAGLLNLLLIIDVIYRDSARRPGSAGGQA